MDFNRNKIFQKVINTGLTVLISVLVIFTVVKAGSLTPSSSPAATSYTLSDIYTRLTTNATSTASNHIFSPGASATGTLYTLTQLYNAIPTIDATKVLTGTSYLGVAGSIANNGAFSLTASSSDQSVTAGYYSGGTLAGDADLATGSIKSGVNIFGTTGTLYGDTDASKVLTMATASGTYNAANLSTSTVKLGTAFGVSQTGALYGDTNAAYVLGTASASGTSLVNLYNGTSGAFTGGSQANGGADDYNNGGAPSTGRYTMGWTACNAGNNYCGTGDTGADAKDDSTGLIWSLLCNGAGCDSFSDTTPMTYSWDNSAANNWSTAQNATSTASGLCTNGDHGKTGWFLPHQKQLMQAYIDGSYGNLEASGVSRYYWSATTKSDTATSAWLTNLSNGSTNYSAKTNATYVRCVRQP